MLSAMDDAVEVVVSAMRKAGLWDDTLVFFNSDVSAVFGANTHTVSHTHTEHALPLPIRFCGAALSLTHRIASVRNVRTVARWAALTTYHSEAGNSR